MDNTKQAVLSIATGMRGLERGIERAGVNIRVAAYVEIEAFIIANLVAEMEVGNLAPSPVWANIKTFPSEMFRGKIHGITAGYPCQPFSNAGERAGTEDPRHIFPDILRVIKSVKPLWCFFENVEGHLSLGYGEVYRSLRDLGYTVEAGIFSAEEAGAPHQRRRLFILATLANTISNRGETGGSKKTFGIEGDASEFINSGFELDDTKFQRLERHIDRDKDSEEWKDKERSVTKTSRWPAKPGQEQYDWEEPRTVTKKELESRLGSTTYGYNFREDLLRMYGNAVVEQTAEIAWIDLWEKINKNYELNKARI